MFTLYRSLLNKHGLILLEQELNWRYESDFNLIKICNSFEIFIIVMTKFQVDFISKKSIEVQAMAS